MPCLYSGGLGTENWRGKAKEVEVNQNKCGPAGSEAAGVGHPMHQITAAACGSVHTSSSPHFPGYYLALQAGMKPAEV